MEEAADRRGGGRIGQDARRVRDRLQHDELRARSDRACVRRDVQLYRVSACGQCRVSCADLEVADDRGRSRSNGPELHALRREPQESFAANDYRCRFPGGGHVGSNVAHDGGNLILDGDRFGVAGGERAAGGVRAHVASDSDGAGESTGADAARGLRHDGDLRRSARERGGRADNPRPGVENAQMSNVGSKCRCNGLCRRGRGVGLGAESNRVGRQLGMRRLVVIAAAPARAEQ